MINARRHAKSGRLIKQANPEKSSKQTEYQKKAEAFNKKESCRCRNWSKRDLKMLKTLDKKNKLVTIANALGRSISAITSIKHKLKQPKEKPDLTGPKKFVFKNPLVDG